jgi:hypothetical protein
MQHASKRLTASGCPAQAGTGRQRITSHVQPTQARPIERAPASEPDVIDIYYEVEDSRPLTPAEVFGATVFASACAAALIAGFFYLAKPSPSPVLVTVSGEKLQPSPRPALDDESYDMEVTPGLQAFVLEAAKRSSMPSGVIAASLTEPKTGTAGGVPPQWRSVGKATDAKGRNAYYDVYVAKTCAADGPQCWRLVSVDWRW